MQFRPPQQENLHKIKSPSSGRFYFTASTGGDDARQFEPKTWLKFKDIDKSIRELRAMFKQHPQWFEVPKPKSDKGQNAVDYSTES